MSNFNYIGFRKYEIRDGWVEYRDIENDSSYFIKRFISDTIVLDDFSLEHLVISSEILDESNLEESLKLIYSTNKLNNSYDADIQEYFDNLYGCVSKSVYEDVLKFYEFIFNKYK